MKSVKHIALGMILTLSVFGAVLYTSCSKQACKGITCLNGGACGGNVCSCPSGIGGNNCETIYRLLYANNYLGSATYNSSVVDSNYVIRTDTGNILQFRSFNDSNYTKMQLVWVRPGKASVLMTITLSKNTPTFSNFSIDAPPVDTFTYTGSGTVNQANASLNLVESHPHSPSVIVTLSNFIKQ